MTVEADLFTALQGLVGGRCYPDQAPEGAVVPYIVWQQVGGVAPSFLERALPSKANARIQVAVWSAGRAQTMALSRDIEGAMVVATAFDAKPLGAAVADFEHDTKRYGARQDFTVWSDR